MYWLIYATVSGAAIAFVFVGIMIENGGVLNEEGIIFGLKSFGIYQMIANCVAHQLQIAIYTRDWNILTTLNMVYMLVKMKVAISLADIIPWSYTSYGL